jgi:hypothetical protein
MVKNTGVTLKKMKQYPFIFSNKWNHRMARHGIFWFCWWVFCSIIYSYIPIDEHLPSYVRFFISAVEALIFLPIHIFIAYSLVYLVVPHLIIKQRYVISAFTVVFLFIITGVLNAFLSPHVGALRNEILNPLFDQPLPKRYAPISFHYAIMAGLRGGITVGGLAAAIKLMKYWYIKEQRNLQLQKENSEARLQLLKAQIHPHFLFNTLNNIYSYTQNTSPTASRLVMGLSDLLRYMLYEGYHSLVPLHKELKMLQDYITLEKVRYDERLDVHLELPKNTDGYYIAPLLLLPLVENCFKHGLSNMVEQPWISLRITLESDSLVMKLVNGKAAGYKNEHRTSGIGLENVLKRLELLYPQKHSFKITDEEDVFIVDLKIELEKKNIKEPAASKQLTPVHANA